MLEHRRCAHLSQGSVLGPVNIVLGRVAAALPREGACEEVVGARIEPRKGGACQHLLGMLVYMLASCSPCTDLGEERKGKVNVELLTRSANTPGRIELNCLGVHYRAGDI